MLAFETKKGSKILFDDSTSKYLLCEGDLRDVIESAERDLEDENPSVVISAAEVIIKLFLYEEMNEEEMGIFIMSMLDRIKGEL